MNIESPYFSLEELCCPHVFQKYGKFAWSFFDPRAIEILNMIRDRIGKAVFINNYEIINDLVVFRNKPEFDERGLRCPRCNIVKEKFAIGEIYMSAHTLGKGFDFDVMGLVAQEVRDWIRLHQSWLPCPIRLEKNVPWVHLDLFGNKEGLKVYEFKV